MEAPKVYHISFAGNLPQELKDGQIQKNRIHYKIDTVHFETKQQMMEFFDDPEKLAHHLKDSHVAKMMLDNYKKKKIFEPNILSMPYYQSESGSKLWFDDVREIDMGFPPLTQKILTADDIRYGK